MAKQYRYVRFTWWREVDLEAISEELEGSFTVEEINLPGTRWELSLYKIERERLKVSADTLRARLALFRAVLYQREPMPFTARDMSLRERVMELYPRITPTPFPMQYSYEPDFEVAE